MSEQATDLTVRRMVSVETPRERAFAVFAEEYESWWPPDHHIGEVQPEAVIMEPREGGRWFERAPDGSECDWGRVLAYEPPERLLLAWHLDPDFRYEPDPALATEIEVRFIAEGPSATRVELEHRGLEVHGEAAERMRAAIASPDGWTLTLERFARAAATGA